MSLLILASHANVIAAYNAAVPFISFAVVFLSASPAGVLPVHVPHTVVCRRQHMSQVAILRSHRLRIRIVERSGHVSGNGVVHGRGHWVVHWPCHVHGLVHWHAHWTVDWNLYWLRSVELHRPHLYCLLHWNLYGGREGGAGGRKSAEGADVVLTGGAAPARERGRKLAAALVTPVVPAVVQDLKAQRMAQMAVRLWIRLRLVLISTTVAVVPRARGAVVAAYVVLVLAIAQTAHEAAAGVRHVPVRILKLGPAVAPIVIVSIGLVNSHYMLAVLFLIYSPVYEKYDKLLA